MTDAGAEDLDAIATALAQLMRGRGRRPGAHGEHGGAHGGAHGGERGGRPGEPWPERGGRGGHGGRGGPHAEAWAERSRGGGGRGGFEAMAARGGPPARLRLLEALAAASHPLSVSEVGEAVGVDQPRASRLIQQGVERGLVRREADPDDARRTRVALTDEGARVARGFRGRRREQLTQALTDFTSDERAELARLLAKLAAAWPSSE